MFSNFGSWDDFLKNQQLLMQSWSDFMKNPSAFTQFHPFSFPNFQDDSAFDFFKQQQQIMETWRKFAEENPIDFSEFQPKYQEWQEAMKNFNPLQTGKIMSKTASDVYEKIMNSNKFYLNLYKAWEQVTKKLLEPSSDELKKQIQKAMESYDKLLLDSFIPVLPKELQGLYLNPYNYIKTLTKAFNDFYQPWSLISKELGAVCAEAILKDPAKMSEAIRLWKDGYDKTFGAMLKSPVVGSSREMIEQNNKMLDALVNFLIISSEFSTKLMGVASDNSRKAFESYFDLLEEGSTPKTFNEFYKFWSEKVETAIDKYFYTDEFSKMIGFVAEAAMKFKIESDKATELFLAGSPVVTTSEIESVYKNVYELKKEIRALKKELNEVKKDLNHEKGAKSGSRAGKSDSKADE